MAVSDRNRNAFSYNSHDVRDKKFIFKNFNKSCSYKSNFAQSSFINTSFIGTKFKFCSLYGATFNGCLIRGALFRKCNLINAKFIDTIISATNFQNTKLKGCKFDNCIIVHSDRLKNFITKSNCIDTQLLDNYPDEKEFANELIQAVEELRNHDFIRRSTTLHRKRGLLDTISISILVSQFGEEFLVKNLPQLPDLISKEFHTLSYIQNLLNKIQKDASLRIPDPSTHRALEIDE